MATNISSHNLTEVIDGIAALIKNPEISADELNAIIKGLISDCRYDLRETGHQGLLQDRQRQTYHKGEGRNRAQANTTDSGSS